MFSYRRQQEATETKKLLTVYKEKEETIEKQKKNILPPAASRIWEYRSTAFNKFTYVFLPEAGGGNGRQRKQKNYPSK